MIILLLSFEFVFLVLSDNCDFQWFTIELVDNCLKEVSNSSVAFCLMHSVVLLLTLFSIFDTGLCRMLIDVAVLYNFLQSLWLRDVHQEISVTQIAHLIFVVFGNEI